MTTNITNTTKIHSIDDLEQLPITISYAGQTTKSGHEWGGGGRPWECDQWRVVIKSESGSAQHTFDYYTGLGLRRDGAPDQPSVANVLHALLMDSSTSDQKFQEWCDEMGYSSDSRRAYTVYKACLRIARKLRECFSPDTLEQIRHVLEEEEI